MSSRRELVDYVAEQLGPRVRFKAMFGEYGIYRDDTLIALFCDDRLYLKRSVAGYELLGDDVEEAPPYPGAKPLAVVPEERWDDADFMRRLAEATAKDLFRPPSTKRVPSKNAAAKVERAAANTTKAKTKKAPVEKGGRKKVSRASTARKSRSQRP